MQILLEAVVNMARSWQQVEPGQLGNLGGNARFQPPAPDRVDQAQHGEAPTTGHVTIIPWWFWLC